MASNEGMTVEELVQKGVHLGTSLENYTAFLNAVMGAIAVHLGSTFDMKWGEEGYTIVITK